MHLVSDRVARQVFQGDPDGLHLKRPPHGTGRLPVADSILPADHRDMRLIFDAGSLRCAHQSDLQSFHSQGLPLRSSDLPVRHRGLPADALHKALIGYPYWTFHRGYDRPQRIEENQEKDDTDASDSLHDCTPFRFV
jgi:hypothetical protein